MRLINADEVKELLYYDKLTCAVIDEVPTVTIHGYPLDALACVAEVMREKGITVEEAVEGMQNVAWCVEMVVKWHREAIERTIDGYLKGARNEADEN